MKLLEHPKLTLLPARAALRYQDVPVDLRPRFEELAGPEPRRQDRSGTPWRCWSTSSAERRDEHAKARKWLTRAMNTPLQSEDFVDDTPLYVLFGEDRYRPTPSTTRHNGMYAGLGLGVSRGLGSNYDAWETFVSLLESFEGTANDLLTVALHV